jgi:hypothetical protein
MLGLSVFRSRFRRSTFVSTNPVEMKEFIAKHIIAILVPVVKVQTSNGRQVSKYGKSIIVPFPSITRSVIKLFSRAQ